MQGQIFYFLQMFLKLVISVSNLQIGELYHTPDLVEAVLIFGTGNGAV